MLIVASFALALCAGVGAAGEPEVAADVGLIKRLGPGAYAKEPFRAPYIAVFGGGGKRLVFVSGDHGDGVDSPVGKTIRYAFSKYAPKAVVVEGLVSGDAADAARRARQAEEFAKHRPDEFPENYYPIHLARRKGVAFAGGEPSLRTKADALAKRGYTAEDVAGLSVAANVGASSAECGADRDRCARMHDGMARDVARKLGIPGRYDFARYEKWYARRVGGRKPAHGLDADDCKPVGGDAATPLQAMAFELELVREQTIVRQIETMLNRHDTVLVVYGSGHLVRQRDVWKNALGPSKDAKPF